MSFTSRRDTAGRGHAPLSLLTPWLLAIPLLALCAAGCAEEITGAEPTLAGPAEPDLICNDTAQLETTVHLYGTGMSPIGVDTATTEPKVWLPSISLSRTLTLERNADGSIGAPTTDDPLEIPGSDPRVETADVLVHWFAQEHMSFDVAPGLTLPEGAYSITVTNPNEGEAVQTAGLVAVPPPALSAINPGAICVAQGDVALALQGAGFLRIDDAGTLAQPTITLVGLNSGLTLSYAPDEMTECITLPAPASNAGTCLGMLVTIPQDDLPPDSYEVTITNPDPAGCHSSEPILLEIVPPPVLESVAPRRLCLGGGTLGLSGTDFRDGATVHVGTQEASSVDVTADGATATALFGLVDLVPGTYDLTIANPEGCDSTLTAAVDVVEGPILFWVDPPVVYNGIATQSTIYGSGLTGSITDVSVVAADGTSTSLAYVLDAARGRIQAVIPLDLAPGVYDLQVDSTDCPAILPGALRVTDQLTLALESIEPPFGQIGADTAVTLFATDPPPAGEIGFVTTPRAYLNPETPTPTTIASEIQAVAFIDAGRLTGIVPGGLPVGVYDVIVVNPAGEVGLLPGGFRISADPPPQIASMSPTLIPSGATETVDLVGQDFRSPSAEWSCRASDGTISTPAGGVTASDATSASVTIDASALNDGDSCVLRLINADGTYVDHSLLGLTGASVNFSGFSPGEPMTTPRRGLSLVMGEATRAARFLYAIGGDDGSEAGAYATSESASVDLFGAPSAWMAQPIGLPGPLTRAQALRLDRFIYLIGGHDSTSATSDAWRAEILDPRDAPVVEDLTARRGMGSGLNPGIWYYRISAVMDAADPRNPGGETLPSDPLVINLPSTVPDTVLITLYWSEVVGATAYRIYRSPDPDLSAGSERLLAEIPATSAREFEDDGSAPGAELPLPLGAHGEWAALPPLNTARAGLGLGHAVDPADPSLHHLYAIGGEDDGGALLSSYEYLTITITSPKDHALGAGWTLGAIDIGAARTDLGVYSVDHDTAGAVAMGETFIYAVAGADAGGGVSDQGAALVVAGGELENPSAPAATSFLALGNAPARAGFAHIAGSHALYMIAGGPSATNNSNRAEICAPGVPGCAGGPPEIVNWNNEGGARPNPGRYLLGSVRDGSFVFIAGGVDTAGTVVDTTEQSVL